MGERGGGSIKVCENLLKGLSEVPEESWFSFCRCNRDSYNTRYKGFETSREHSQEKQEEKKQRDTF
jgi:hypothetical protein